MGNNQGQTLFICYIQKKTLLSHRAARQNRQTDRPRAILMTGNTEMLEVICLAWFGSSYLWHPTLSQLSALQSFLIDSQRSRLAQGQPLLVRCAANCPISSEHWVHAVFCTSTRIE